MIILSAFSLFYHIIHLSIYDAEIRFTFCFRYQYVKERFGQFIILNSQFIIIASRLPCPEVETRGLGPQCRAGSRLSFHMRFTETRELQHLSQALPANLAVLKSASFVLKGGVPAAPSGTATLLRLSPNHQFCLRPILAVTDFRHPRLSWLDGRCVQGPGTYSPRHG